MLNGIDENSLKNMFRQNIVKGKFYYETRLPKQSLCIKEVFTSSKQNRKTIIGMTKEIENFVKDVNFTNDDWFVD